MDETEQRHVATSEAALRELEAYAQRIRKRELLQAKGKLIPADRVRSIRDILVAAFRGNPEKWAGHRWLAKDALASKYGITAAVI